MPDTQTPEVIAQRHFPEFTFDAPCGANAEMFDWLRPVLDQAYQRADTILETNRRLLVAGEYDAVPLDVDALGTAEKVNLVKQEFGEDSVEYQVKLQALFTDCDRKLDEAETKNTHRYFAPVTYTYNPVQDEVFADGLSYDAMVVSGLTPVAEPEERYRRRHDFAKSEVQKAIIKRPDCDRVAVLQTSFCPDYALASLERNPKGSHGGYAPEVSKIMVNFDTFDPATGHIFHEQVAIPGKPYIDEEIVIEAYQIIGLVEAGDTPDKTDIYGIQGLVDRGMYTEALDFVALLDELAGRKHGVSLFMGEVVDEDHPKDYQALKQQAEQDRRLRQQRTRELVDYTLELETTGVDHAFGTVMQNKYIKDMLLREAEANPEVAIRAFDHQTAVGFYEAQALKSAGRYQEAEELLEETRINAPAAGGCGADSCGLENPDDDSLETRLAKIQLNIRDGDELLKDKIRKCKCGGTIYYSNNSGQKSYKKYCNGCGALEKDGKIIRQGNKQDKAQQQSWMQTISPARNN